MFRLIYLIILLLFVTISSPYLIGNQGAVIIELGNYTIQSSVIVVVVAIIIILAILYLIEVFFRTLGKVLFGYSKWIINYRDNKAEQQTQQAIILKGQGSLDQAKKLLLKSCKNSRFPLVNLMEAFEIAMTQEKYKEAAEIFNQVMIITDDDYILLLQSMRLRLLVAMQDYQQAKQLLKVIPVNNLNQQLLLIAIDVYQQTSSYHELNEVLEIAIKNHQISNDVAKNIRLQIENNLVDSVINRGDDLLNWFRAQSKSCRNNLSLRNYMLHKLLFINEQQADDFALYSVKKFSVEQLENSDFFSILLHSNLTLQSKVNQALLKLFNHDPQVAIAVYLAKLSFKFNDPQIKRYVDYLVDNKVADMYSFVMVVYQELGLRKEVNNIQQLIAQQIRNSL